MKEFNLSEKAKHSMKETSSITREGVNDFTFNIGDVKEFIRRLKEELSLVNDDMSHTELFELIDKLAGNKLT